MADTQPQNSDLPAGNLAISSAEALNTTRPFSTILAAKHPPNVAFPSAEAPKASNSANRKRALWKEKRLDRLLSMTRERGSLMNRDVRRILRVKQSTATEYLAALVARGSLFREGKSKYTKYHL